MSNFPPGVNGSEYQIAGPDLDYETEGICDRCVLEGDVKKGVKVPVIIQGYRGETWAECENGHSIDLDDCDDTPPEPDYEEIALARAEARADRYDR